MIRTTKHIVLGVALVAILTASSPLFAKEKTLYNRLGGKKAITAVVDEFVGRVAADTRINKFFADAAGGPCKYTGKDMKSAHAGMGVSGADFGASVEDLVGALGPMKSDIVTK